MLWPRWLQYVRTLAEFISQPQYKNVIPMFSVLNEASPNIGYQPLRSWLAITFVSSFIDVQRLIRDVGIRRYYQVYQLLRMIGGVGEGKGPFMVIHDGFGGAQLGQRAWDGFLPGADRLGLDTHSYLCFNAQSADSVETNAAKTCQMWAPLVNQTLANFGLSVTGEFS